MNIEQWDEHIAIKNAMDDLIHSLDVSAQMKEMVLHVCASGGKMVRPIILMLSTQLCGGRFEDSIDASLAIELIHSASLIQDDVLDEGILRRGMPSTHRMFGYSSAILCGDFLISKAIELISSYDRRSVRDFGRAGMHMSEGEIMDIMSINEDFGMDEYMECIRKKTASLFAASASIGAYVGGADEKTAEVCRSFGYNVGTAYQMVDDILEYVQIIQSKESENISLSLPSIYQRRMSPERAISRSVGLVEEYVSSARSEIAYFKSSQVTDKLLEITDYITLDMLTPDILQK
ncbi:Polyprenyl synthetase [Methanosalsum zhilinae DSM 4017]|uniref:Polyprenyl synthetase n=1 Tax=Methanosalsum zhilinae (strain DSM 4017 / NBRC 107636 / OCM 62 / WeN5) TaxID=679901 RepID=F7XP34_METZD|nr:polyprenyl synthetase family protein [Methanosalsum zhilinae]AEH61326.1 Polyprenyl synthetase [Methanosalsum zhilinae DSM 4017]